jgi:hypothetical protein
MKLKTDTALQRNQRVTATSSGTVEATFDPAKALGTVIYDSKDGWVEVELDFNGILYVLDKSKEVKTE